MIGWASEEQIIQFFSLPICYPAPTCLFSISLENSQCVALEQITLESKKLLRSTGQVES